MHLHPHYRVTKKKFDHISLRRVAAVSDVYAKFEIGHFQLQNSILSEIERRDRLRHQRIQPRVRRYE